MAVMIDTVANVKIKPDFSGFVSATEEELAETIHDATECFSMEMSVKIARALLAGNWIIPR